MQLSFLGPNSGVGLTEVQLPDGQKLTNELTNEKGKHFCLPFAVPARYERRVLQFLQLFGTDLGIDPIDHLDGAFQAIRLFRRRHVFALDDDSGYAINLVVSQHL